MKEKAIQALKRLLLTIWLIIRWPLLIAALFVFTACAVVYSINFIVWLSLYHTIAFAVAQMIVFILILLTGMIFSVHEAYEKAGEILSGKDE